MCFALQFKAFITSVRNYAQEENSPKIAQESVAHEEEPSEEIAETRRVMFETDNWK